MRLKHIKLAGFKSFVDPTKVPFEQQMTAIVGPNGCGKSNIIDAVRWVLGESSAKNLRGDAMTDVIFNGAESRKPIGQASVELVFDNIDGRIQGNMADRNQISIRRVVNRESTNTYFLNGTKCRRRDITDIFLGTGLGPRSYAIIEQGTISRLIESKPQELRVFIDEAAGISKYKERRRDTENRIRHTRENLSRLQDIRSELSLQIDKLHKQSEAAKRFRTLKAQERKYKAELAVLRWQEFNGQSKEFQQTYEIANTEIEKLTQYQSEKNIELFQVKQQIDLGTSNVTEFQNSKILLTNNIARTEQNIKHIKQQSVTIKQNNELTKQQLINAESTLKKEQEKQKQLTQRLLIKTPEFTIIETQVTDLQTSLNKLSIEQQNSQLLWKSTHEKLNAADNKKAVINNNIALEQQKKQQAETQLTAYNHQLLDVTPHLHKKNEAVDKCQQLELQLTTLITNSQISVQTIEQIQSNINEAQRELASDNASLNAFKNNVQTIKDQINNKQNWQVKQHQQLLNNIPSFPEKITVITDELQIIGEWQEALSSILSYWQQAEVVESVNQTIEQIESLSQVLLVESKRSEDKSIANKKAQSVSAATIKKGTIAHLMSDVPMAFSFLNQIFIAENINEAQKILPLLAFNESIICKDTTWLGHGFVRKGHFESVDNVLSLNNQQSLLLKNIANIEKNIADKTQKINSLNKKLNAVQQNHEKSSQQVDKIKDELQIHKQKAFSDEQNQQFYLKQSEQLQQQITSNQFLVQQCDKALEQLTEQLQKLSIANDEALKQNSIVDIESQQNQLQSQHQQVQTTLKTLSDQRQEQAIMLEQLKNEKEQSTEAINNAEYSIEQLIKQQQSNADVIEGRIEPLKLDEKNLLDWLKEMAEVDGNIHKIQYTMAESQAKATQLENEQKQRQENILSLREQAAKAHLDAENYRLRAETALEALQETQLLFTDTQNNMPNNAKESIWQAHIIRLSKDISRLGAINLAAIDEYESQLSRKQYLDSQNNDLTQAISTLESAIEKIDKESRLKFKATFEQVNKDLKTLFPKVFGGGKAYLELTGTDMLDTGVTIMAQPPGKKNSTIHLLSGGEKALTALSLVFAIFRLNPAPFCMLDEVDAPLDDANVSRFCNLVREMSRTVQFIYISHNKIAMEMASHLTGVTMFEPGVSKMVAVDIEEALAMAEIS